jgi:sugar/nucleoside kinase (ribokinase family)
LAVILATASFRCSGRWCPYTRNNVSTLRAPGQRAVQVETPAIDVVDTVGAGDSFQAALLFALRDIGRIKRSELAQMERRRAWSGAVIL